ncbi:inner nuclear membrane protein Man1 [Narcine bancroftii]|uniref:inner nuclear membrane protein Man1 n=1 Tax=Narcine bancroftii TaxID=1343680 RepID=UPI003831EB95
MAAQLTDAELCSELKKFGLVPGPVTENTRPVYVKKLKKLREERGARPKTRNGGGAGPGSGLGGAATSLAPPLVSPGKLLGFSSDESDAEANGRGEAGRASDGTRARPGSSGRGRSPPPPRMVSSSNNGGAGASAGRSNSTPWWRPNPNRGARQAPEEEEQPPPGTEPHAGNASRVSYIRDGDYSDSEDEREERGRRPNSRRSQSKRSGTVARSDPPGTAEENGAGRRGGPHCLDPRNQLEDQREEKDAAEAPGISTLRNRNSSCKKMSSGILAAERDILCQGTRNSNHIGSIGPSIHNSNILTVRSGPSSALLIDANHSNHTGINQNYSTYHRKSPGEPEEELLQQFKREGGLANGGFSAHYLSMFLLTAACLFFLGLGLTYIRMRGSGGSEEGILNVKPQAFEIDDKVEERKIILIILHRLHSHLAKIAGEYDCGDHVHYKNRSLSVQDAAEYVTVLDPNHEDKFNGSLQWILQSTDDFGIKLLGNDSDVKVNDVSQVLYLESTHPQMSFICRFRRAFLTVLHRMFIFLVGVGVVWGVLHYMKYRWRKEESETKQMYDMVERIIDVLRSHNEACQENKDLQPYLPILHIRDALVPPQNRKKMKKAWERAVDFVETNESRIRKETQRIAGENFMVWSWMQPSSACDKITVVPSKVWQGKAFDLDGRNSPPNSLTPCLKIRNMFDPVMEIGDDWHVAIQEAILEKCNDNEGIVHIAVDKNSREGCVYVKCLSPEYAGKAFKALHGSWFDGKLVTVKYLRLDRYHYRFPQAVHCNTPLKPSNRYMNSMSHLRLLTNTANSPGAS